MISSTIQFDGPAWPFMRVHRPGGAAVSEKARDGAACGQASSCPRTLRTVAGREEVLVAIASSCRVASWSLHSPL